MTDFYLKKLSGVKAFIFDFDGVFTDGMVHVHDDGTYTRSTNIKDGYAINKAIKKGYKIAVISGGGSAGVVARLNQLGVKDVFIQTKDKLAVLESWLELNNLTANDCLMMGDDEPDLPVLNFVGFSCCPADAVAEIRHSVDYVSVENGGKGSVRDIVEKKLRLDNNW